MTKQENVIVKICIFCDVYNVFIIYALQLYQNKTIKGCIFMLNSKL